MVSRRGFLSGATLLSVGAAVPSVFGKAVAAGALDHHFAADGTAGKLLVIVQLAGGNDGLNTVIPYRDSHYRSLRRGVALDESEVVPLDGRLALHPSLAPLKPFWDQRAMAVVEGVGYPDHSQSHFEAMHAWQTASPDGKLQGGWAGRYLDALEAQFHHPLHGFNAGSELAPEMTTGLTSVPAAGEIDDYGLHMSGDEEDAERRQRTMLRLYETFPSQHQHAALLETTLDDALDTTKLLRSAIEEYAPAVDYPGGPFANGLRTLAALSTAEGALRVGHVTLGGFDTHSGQSYEHGAQLAALGEGVAAFLADMEARGRGNDVVVMTWSEFGRRAESNDSDGTDHGTSGPMLLLGRGLRGGTYGEPPPLDRLDDNGNLRVTTDFRSVYATLLDRWFGVDTAPIVGSGFSPLGFL